MEIKFKILIVVFVIVILAVVIVLWKKNASKPQGDTFDGDGFVDPASISRFSYHRGGGALNAFYNLTVEAGKLTVERCDGNGCKVYRKSYTLPQDFLGNIQNVIADAGIRQFERNLPVAEMFAFDAETISVSVSFADGKTVSFDSTLEVPDGGWNAVNEIVRLLESIADK